jgi:4-amino-4-deoxy-L-arabinose transferase-like glycosyltransferase
MTPREHERGPIARTELAWRRTALAAVALAAIVTRAGAVRHDARSVCSGALALCVALTFWFCGRLRAPSPSAPATTALMVVAGLAVTALSAAVCVIVVLGR